jgi:hypothetical protein
MSFRSHKLLAWDNPLLKKSAAAGEDALQIRSMDWLCSKLMADQTLSNTGLVRSNGTRVTRLVCEIVGKRCRIQPRTLLNKNDSMIEWIFNIGASFYTPWEQRKTGKHEHSSSETSTNIQTQHFQEAWGIKHWQQCWQSWNTKNTFDYTIK